MVGYGGTVEVPTLDLVAREIKIGGSLVGDYIELVELMEMNAPMIASVASVALSASDSNQRSRIGRAAPVSISTAAGRSSPKADIA